MIKLVRVPFLIPFRFSGMTLGRVILLSRLHKPSVSAVAHEIYHTYQWAMYGWSFLPRYIAAWVRGGFFHRNNEFEIRAYQGQNYSSLQREALELLEKSGFEFDRH